MKTWYIFLFFGALLISYSAKAGNLSANPWLKKNPVSTANSQVQPKAPNYYENPAVSENTYANPWTQNSKENSATATKSQLRQELKSVAENSQKSIQNLSEQAHRLAELSAATSQNQNGGSLTNLVGGLSVLMRDKQQIQPENDTNSFNFGSFSAFNTEGGRKRYNNIRQETSSFETEVSQAYRRTTDKIKRNIRSKYNAAQRQIEPYTNSARNAVKTLEKDSGISMEQIQKIMH